MDKQFEKLYDATVSSSLAYNAEVLEFNGHKIQSFFSDKQVVLLCRIVNSRQIGEIDDLVKEGVDINCRGKWDMTPLIWNFQFTYLNALADSKYYQEICREVNTSDHQLNFPLLQMFLDDRARCIERLLYYGADPNHKVFVKRNFCEFPVPMTEGMTFMHLVAMQYDWRVKFNLLPSALKYGGNPNVVDEELHITPLFLACKSYWEMGYRVPSGASPLNVGLLIDAGADIEHRDTQGNTPLVVAAAGENFDVVLMLLEAGAKDEGKSVVKYLRKSKQKNPHISTKESIDPYYNKVVDFLKAKGALSDADIDVLTEPPPDNVKPFVDPIPGARRPFDPYADEWIQKRKEKLKDE